MNLYKGRFRPTPELTWTLNLSFFDHFIGGLNLITLSMQLPFKQDPQ